MNLTKVTAARWGFGTEKRPSVAIVSMIKNPSPTNYLIPSKMVEGPRNSFG